MPHIHTRQGSYRWTTIVACSMFCLYAKADVTPECTDTTQLDAAKVALVNDSVPTKAHNGFFKKVINYFRDSNKQKPNKKIDFGFIPGPNYSATTGFGLGLLGTATYSADRTDPTLPRSNASVYSNMTTAGFFLVGLRGNHIFPHEKFQLDYKVNLSTFSTSYWGMGYEIGRAHV